MPKRSKNSTRASRKDGGTGQRVKCPEPDCTAQIKERFLDNHMRQHRPNG